MDNIVNAVVEAIKLSGLVQIEVMDRHVFLTQKEIDILFGKGYQLKSKCKSSQPHQFICEESVNLIGNKERIDNVLIMGPAADKAQIIITKTDSINLGVKAPVRSFGDISGTGSIILEGTNGAITIDKGVMVAKAQIYMTPELAKKQDLIDKQSIMVEVLSNRPIVYRDVIVNVSEQFCYKMNIDLDEANAADINQKAIGRIIKTI